MFTLIQPSSMGLLLVNEQFYVHEGMFHLEGFKFLNLVMPKVFKLSLATQPFNFGNQGLKIFVNYRVVVPWIVLCILEIILAVHQNSSYYCSLLLCSVEFLIYSRMIYNSVTLSLLYVMLAAKLIKHCFTSSL
jgi:hypothetical protein